MRILILANYANGLWLFRKEVLTAFMEDGHDVYVSVPPDENTDKIRALRGNGRTVQIIETPFERRGNNPFKDAVLFLTYRRMLKRCRPDVVLTYTIKPNLYGGLACRLGRIPYFCTITGLGTAIEKGGALSRILLCFYRISMKKAERVFFQNAGNQEFMKRHGVAVNNSMLLPGSGVNLKEHPFHKYPSEKDGIHLLAVIRIMKAKGIEEYLEAARRMKRKDDRIHFWLAGEYEQETQEQYEPVIQELMESGTIRYLGHTDHIDEVMAQSHIIVHPSYHEGLSNVLLEAAACGRPVLASRVSGCTETFCEGKSGYSFEQGSVDALVMAIEKILQLSAGEREAMGIAGRAWVEEKFDRQIVIRIYRELLAKWKEKSDAR